MRHVHIINDNFYCLSHRSCYLSPSFNLILVRVTSRFICFSCDRFTSQCVVSMYSQCSHTAGYAECVCPKVSELASSARPQNLLPRISPSLQPSSSQTAPTTSFPHESHLEHTTQGQVCSSEEELQDEGWSSHYTEHKNRIISPTQGSMDNACFASFRVLWWKRRA